MKHFVQLTLVRIKDPQKFNDPRNPFIRTPKAEDMESIRSDFRADAIFSVTTAADYLPPGVKSLVGVRTVGEFWVSESRHEVIEILEKALAE
jgi:hypothetical protein